MVAEVSEVHTKNKLKQDNINRDYIDPNTETRANAKAQS